MGRPRYRIVTFELGRAELERPDLVASRLVRLLKGLDPVVEVEVYPPAPSWNTWPTELPAPGGPERRVLPISRYVGEVLYRAAKLQEGGGADE